VANRLGARFAAAVATAGPAVRMRGATPVGIPLRRSIAELDLAAARPAARRGFELDERPVLLVTGGSQGARRINAAVCDAARVLAQAGVQVLHVAGAGHAAAVRDALGEDAPATHHVLDYVDGMDNAYAAADLVLCRAGAMTCAELAAVGLPAVYVPLPIGNGEQALNAEPTIRAGGGLLIADADLDADHVEGPVLSLLTDGPRLVAMGAAAQALGHRDADERIVDLVLGAVR
jgi:UDP-N-acetylglucosamine--N-acetylmuramyl-(pentapeptide) pyrophosphoryl-undecaprenol N-acetylglucosamine transferase